MRLVASSVRSGKLPWADDACADWARRITRHFPFEERVIRPSTAAGEAEALLGALPARGRLVALDERGDDISSTGLAALLERCAQDGVTSLVFAIGGPYGHAPEVRERAWKVHRLSAMVLAHAVARVVLVEQIYRACTIRKGEPYHHA
ncbi:MAG: 23S rRNA (pseudouridine(1915)-N(3))-methyltransferase RlmH [Pseudomonadota bacterium]|nr:23S rRNA (pseudouridine(1915)-N(3))-methyltransferase RlmH [Pseudomonadota bacterium]